jgi:hypothetical protein
MNISTWRSVNPSDDWSRGAAPVFTPMSYPRLQEFKAAQKA